MFREPFPILYVSDLERSLRFYCDVLGFTETYRWPQEGPGQFVYLKLGSTGIGLSPYTVAEQIQGRPVARGGQAPDFEVCLTTDDIEAASQRLLASGAKRLRPINRMDWGERMVLFADPDGHVIHVASPE